MQKKKAERRSKFFSPLFVKAFQLSAKAFRRFLYAFFRKGDLFCSQEARLYQHLENISFSRINIHRILPLRNALRQIMTANIFDQVFRRFVPPLLCEQPSKLMEAFPREYRCSACSVLQARLCAGCGYFSSIPFILFSKCSGRNMSFSPKAIVTISGLCDRTSRSVLSSPFFELSPLSPALIEIMFSPYFSFST